MADTSLYDREWDEDAARWFHRFVTGYLQEHLDDYYGGPDVNDPELVAAVADAMLARRADFARWVEPPWYDPEVGAEGRWEIDPHAMKNGTGLVWQLADDCERRLRLEREVQKFPTLDDWLEALARGDVATAPPAEPCAADLLGVSRAAWRKACSRRTAMRRRGPRKEGCR